MHLLRKYEFWYFCHPGWFRCVRLRRNLVFFCTSAMLMCFTGCAVNTDVLQICICAKFFEYRLKDALLLPLCKTFVNAVPFSISFREISLWSTASDDPNDVIYSRTNIFIRGPIWNWNYRERNLLCGFIHHQLTCSDVLLLSS